MMHARTIIAADSLPPLTVADRQTLPLAALPVKVIAHRLGVSESAAKQRLRHLERSFGVTHREAVIYRAARCGITLEIMEARQ